MREHIDRPSAKSSVARKTSLLANQHQNCACMAAHNRTSQLPFGSVTMHADGMFTAQSHKQEADSGTVGTSVSVARPCALRLLERRDSEPTAPSCVPIGQSARAHTLLSRIKCCSTCMQHRRVTRSALYAVLHAPNPWRYTQTQCTRRANRPFPFLCEAAAV
jgi:hypothetical protein